MEPTITHAAETLRPQGPGHNAERGEIDRALTVLAYAVSALALYITGGPLALGRTVELKISSPCAHNGSPWATVAVHGATHHLWEWMEHNGAKDRPVPGHGVVRELEIGRLEVYVWPAPAA